MTPYSTRESFDRYLQNLMEQVLVLGNMVEQAITQSVAALQQYDRLAAKRVYDGDQRINEKRYSLENECVTLIATQQPMARDVRLLAAVLEIITELERIGDYAKGIAKITLQLSDERTSSAIFEDLRQMSEQGLAMLHRALDAFVAGDAAAAREIPSGDDDIDNLYIRVYEELTQQIIGHTTSVQHANLLMWAAHNLERMGDRIINICERTVYVSTGSLKELDPGEGTRLINDL